MAKTKMLYFVIEKSTNVIQKITWQQKRADSWLDSTQYTVSGFNPEIYPTVTLLKVGQKLEEHKLEKI